MKLIYVILLLPIIGYGQLQTSGPISLGDMRTETNNTGPYSMGDGRTAIGGSGPVAMSDFYGFSNDAIDVTPVSKTAAPGGETYNVTITATGAWTCTNKPTWITMATSGSGSQSLSITVSANNTGQSRNVSLLFQITSNPSVTDQHTVFQFPL